MLICAYMSLYDYLVIYLGLDVLEQTFAVYCPMFSHLEGLQLPCGTQGVDGGQGDAEHFMNLPWAKGHTGFPPSVWGG